MPSSHTLCVLAMVLPNSSALLGAPLVCGFNKFGADVISPSGIPSEATSLDTENMSDLCAEQSPRTFNGENRLTIHPNLTFCHKLSSSKDVGCRCPFGSCSFLPHQFRENQTPKHPSPPTFLMYKVQKGS
ncbi:hypothetical protein EV421DRAFT_1821504 [Armillaria borealis]|uniref:Secreted protein n=1 Tax=Armillaria borealis TaxID=47425 RepID=A0AA39MLE6_9AGAR|nr:hypothetical protein EV421DRAFT_1821504 [Armillaria borealis]